MDVLFILFLLFWIAGAFLIGYVASQKGRDGFTWGILSLIVSPLITLIALAVLSSPTQRLPSSATIGVEARVEAMTKKCPDCAETIKLEAVVCRYCGHKFDADQVRRAVEALKTEGDKGASSMEGSGGQGSLFDGGQRVIYVIRRVGLNIEDSPTGVLVTAVIPGTPGDAAGLQPGDVIVSLNGAEVKRSSAFISEVTRHAPGAIGSIEVMRNGSRCGVSVTY